MEPGRRTLILPVRMRPELKEPLGDLIEGEPGEAMARLKEILREKVPPMFASVGDFVTANALEACLDPDIIVIDHRIMRADVDPLEHDRPEIFVRNQPGTINAGAYRALEGAVTLKRRLAVIVEGEEDLLVLPLMAVMPEGSVIVYGQPGKGVVVVTIDEERRRWVLDFMNRMEEAGAEDRADIDEGQPPDRAA